MPLYIFECPEHGRDERLCKVGTIKSSCKHCTYLMPRVYQYAVALGHAEPDTRGMFRRFQEASADLDAKGVNTPGLWDATKRRAQAMAAAGESPYRTVERN